jgi:membrane protein
MAQQEAIRERGRGRRARTPSEIPGRGWKDVLLRTWNETGRDNISIIAAGVAFYGFLSIFPALAALVSLYGLAFGTAEMQQHIAQLQAVLPREAADILNAELQRIVTGAETKLSISFVISLMLALWSANRGMDAMFTALNIVYDEEDHRNFFTRTALTLLFTFGAVLFALLALLIIVGVPIVINFLGLPQGTQALIGILTWLILLAGGIIALGILYRFVPYRERPRWRWVSWGSVLAVVIWLAGSLLFSWYVASFGNYNESYGSLGAVVVLLMWFYISAYVVLLGAELNSEMEHQTAEDTTEGRSKPLGQRGAYVADTIGEAH